ncbi:hypothetical protein [Dactylosporangium sp. NPDC050588]|uniref:hypothetical protein n=1 Tax=Dactylosporangium sp. NPDC050588 TaxID=3157211 RepID=UPI0033C13A91
MAEDQVWVDREALVAALEGEGFHLQAPTRLRPDVQRLRRLAAQNLQSLAADVSIATPDGPVTLTRSVEPLLGVAAGNVAITGAPGSGKSALLSAYASEIGRQADLVVLRADELRGSAGQTRQELNLRHDLVEVLRGWSGPRRGVLLLDGLDQTRGADASGWLSHLASQLRGTRWRIVASIRSFDLRQGRRWKEMFGGEPVDAQHADPDLHDIRHLLVEDLDEEELGPLLKASPHMARVIQAADPRVRQIMANPFNIDIAGKLLAAGLLTGLDLVTSRIDLLDQYWLYRVTGDGGNSYDRTCALRATIDHMVTDRRQQVGDPATLRIDGAARTALRELIRDGVVRELPRKPGYPNPPIALAHPVLFDYAVAVLALGDVTVADSLADRLDDDPNLSMIVRPSLDYRLGISWRTDPSRTSFWQLALRLAADDAGHELAAAAAASVAAQHLASADDLRHLTRACTGADSAGGRCTAPGAQRLMFLVAAAVGVHSTTKSIAFEAVSAAAYDLASLAQTRDDIDLALLAAQLLGRAHGTNEPAPNTPAAHHWTRAAAACMTVALRDPHDASRRQLADVSSRIFAIAVVLDAATTASAAVAVIARSTMQAWGTTVVLRLVDRLPDIARQAPDLAVEIGASIWEFDETSTEKTSINDSRIMSLTSTRAQDLDTARYSIGTKFQAVAAVDPEAAARLLIRVVEAPRMFRWNHSRPSAAQPHIRFGETLRYSGGHDAAQTMTAALVDTLGRLAESEDLESAQQDKTSLPPQSTALGPVAALLIGGLTHSEVWQSLLHRAVTAESPTLALALAPALASEALFSSSETWIYAGHLTKRVSDLIDPTDHLAVEAAILAATEPEPDDSDDADDPGWRNRANARQQRRREILVAALDRTKVSDPVVERHLTEMTASGQPLSILPEMPEPDRAPDAAWEPEPDDSPTPDGPLTAALYEVAEHLRQLNHDDPTVREQAGHRLPASWLRLHAEIAASDGSSDLGGAHRTLLEAALQLARSRQVDVGSVLGKQMLGALTAACPPVAKTRRGDAADSDWNGAYTVTPSTTALQGLTALLRQPAWRTVHGHKLRRLVQPLLDSDSLVYRLLSLDAITAIFEEPDDLRNQLGHRLITETDKHILTQLIVTAANRYLRSEPAAMDQILQNMANSPQWAVLAEDTSGDDALGGNDHTHQAVGALTILATTESTAFASRTIQTWLSSPANHPNRASRVCSWLRDYLNPADPTLDQTQEQAFALLALPLEQAHAIWQQVTQATTADERLKQAASNVAVVAHHATQQLYFASGAFDDKKPATSRTARGKPNSFAERAVPLLEAYGHIHHPAVTHHIIQTLDHISAEQPKAVLIAAVRSAADDHAYAQEPLAVDAVLQLITRYLADHRDLVLGDPECTTAVRKLLETFIRAGWNQAIHMAERMDDMFR